MHQHKTKGAINAIQPDTAQHAENSKQQHLNDVLFMKPTYY